MPTLALAKLVPLLALSAHGLPTLTAGTSVTSVVATTATKVQPVLPFCELTAPADNEVAINEGKFHFIKAVPKYCSHTIYQ